MYESDLQWGWTVTQQEFLFNPSLQYPFLLRSACCCFVTLSTSRGPALPRHLANEARALTYTQRIAYFYSNPGRLTTCQLRTRNLPLSPPYEPLCTGGFGVGGSSVTPTTCFKKQHRLFISNRLELGKTAHTTSTLSSIFFPRAFTFYSRAIRSYLECVTRAILHHLTALVPPLQQVHTGGDEGVGLLVKETAVSQGGD